MTLPLGTTRDPVERRRFLVEAIQALEEGLATAATKISYPNAGEMETLSRSEAVARLRLFLANLAELDGDAALAAKVTPAATLIRVFSARGYRSRGIY